jgi:hypothetical protein
MSGRLPDAKTLKDALEQLYGRDVYVRPAKAIAVPKGAVGEVAVFRHDDDTLAALCIADLPFAASCGAALTMIPPPVVAEQLKAGAIADTVEENFREVMNVCSALLNPPGSRHVRLVEVVNQAKTAPKPADALLPAAKDTLHVEIEIDGYPTGHVTLLAA